MGALLASPEVTSLGLRYLGFRQRTEREASGPFFVGSVDIERNTVYELPACGAIIGRAPESDIRIASNAVAPQHARVHLHDDRQCLVVSDLGGGLGSSSSRTNDGELLLLSLGDVLTVAGRFDFEVVALPLEETAA